MKNIDIAINEVEKLKTKLAKTLKANADAKAAFEAESDDTKKADLKLAWETLVEKNKEALKPLTDKEANLKKLQDAKDKRIEDERLAAEQKRMREEKEQAARDALTREFEELELAAIVNDNSLTQEERDAAASRIKEIEFNK